MVRLETYSSLTCGQDRLGERADSAKKSIHYVDIIKPYGVPLRPIGAHRVHHDAVMERCLPASPVSRDSSQFATPAGNSIGAIDRWRKADHSR